MKECDILWGQNILWPSYLFSGVTPPTTGSPPLHSATACIQILVTDAQVSQHIGGYHKFSRHEISEFGLKEPRRSGYATVFLRIFWLAAPFFHANSGIPFPAAPKFNSCCVTLWPLDLYSQRRIYDFCGPVGADWTTEARRTEILSLKAYRATEGGVLRKGGSEHHTSLGVRGSAGAPAGSGSERSPL